MRPAAIRSVCTQPGTAAGRVRPSISGGTGPPPVARTVQSSCSAFMLVLLVDNVADVLRRGGGTVSTDRSRMRQTAGTALVLCWGGSGCDPSDAQPHDGP